MGDVQFEWVGTRFITPQTLTEAFITRILKPGKDPSMCSSYRPISLLNVDVKILAKILAFRIDSLIPEIISPDQTGFVKGRYSYTNLRRLLGVLYSPAFRETPEVVVSLDAEKAFDRVEWGYLFFILKRFGFGPKYVNWIQLLYSTPKVSVITNKVRSQFFPILRGTRQGCPLNPLLFALAKEPLSIMLKSLQSIKGIDRMGIEHRVSLYADDMLLYISNPVENVPKIVQNLSTFSNFSGYKFNFSISFFKSLCFPIRGLHGLKTEARTRPVPEIVWPDPTWAAQLNLEPEPDPKSYLNIYTYSSPSQFLSQKPFFVH